MKCVTIFLLAVVLVAAVSAHTTARLRRAVSQDPGKSQGPKKQKPNVPSLDLSGLKSTVTEDVSTPRPQKVPKLQLDKVNKTLSGPDGPQDFMPAMATTSKEVYDRYFAQFNQGLELAKTNKHPLLANNFPEFTVAGMKVNLVFYSAATGFELNPKWVKYDQAFAQSAMEFLKTNFLRLHTKMNPEVFAKVKSLKVLAAPIDISSVATVWAAPGQGERVSEYQSVIFIGKLAYNKIEGCSEVTRGLVVADCYSVAIKNPAARPFAFFLHEFGHVVMMTTQTEQFTKMNSVCLEQLPIAETDFPKMADSMSTFLKSIKAVPNKIFYTPAPYFGSYYGYRVSADVSHYATAKVGVCGYLEYIAEVWSAALLGMPKTSSGWEVDFFKLLVPGMPLHHEPALPDWCPAGVVTNVQPPPRQPKVVGK